MRAALSDLAAADRQLLLDHAEGLSTSDLAAATDSTPGAIATRLSRTRARLRLDYLLALRRVDLPTANCRSVLLAVSASDQRRQHALNAAKHLASCATCVDLVPPLSERKSALAGIGAAPLIALGGFEGRFARLARNGTAQAVAGVTAVAVVAGAYAITRDSRTQPAAIPARPAAAATSTPARVRTVAGINLMPVPGAHLTKALVGQRVIVQGMVVQSVVSHPGFWIGTASNRLYVHLDNIDLIKKPILAGHHVSFVAVLRLNPANYASSDGVDALGGAGLLTDEGVHLSVDSRRVTQR